MIIAEISVTRLSCQKDKREVCYCWTYFIRSFWWRYFYWSCVFFVGQTSNETKYFHSHSRWIEKTRRKIWVEKKEEDKNQSFPFEYETILSLGSLLQFLTMLGSHISFVRMKFKLILYSHSLKWFNDVSTKNMEKRKKIKNWSIQNEIDLVWLRGYNLLISVSS